MRLPRLRRPSAPPPARSRPAAEALDLTYVAQPAENPARQLSAGSRAGSFEIAEREVSLESRDRGFDLGGLGAPRGRGGDPDLGFELAVGTTKDG